MMGLGRHIGREHAHDLVYDLCREAIATERPLLDLLAANAEINAHLDRAALARLCDPAHYLGASGRPWSTRCCAGATTRSRKDERRSSLQRPRLGFTTLIGRPAA